MMKKNQLYKGFRVLDVVPVPDCNSTGIWLKHEKSGMEVFHLLNDDEENLFAFSFRTPSLDSTGAAHVLEHSVLCGSKKYPLKDPFINMANQSVNTFLNAMTYPDHTVYPAASIVKADYFNLMSVYADAAFFPLLEPEIFMQECRRLELDEKGKPNIQGVVYNEMKGSYSDLNSVCFDTLKKVSLAGTSYEYDSGGDPLEIPYLTHSKLKAFHKKYYTPANCLVFLYGNIPTEEQLSFIDTNVLSKVKTPGTAVKWEKYPSSRNTKSWVKEYGPSTDKDNKKAIVNLVWTIASDKIQRGKTSVESLFLSNLLWGDDSAPVAKALIESGLGEDLSPQSGANLDILFPSIVCGLRGVEEKNSRKVEKIIEKALENICINGISQGDLNRTCMVFEFSNREIHRAGGPYSLVYMDRCLRGWQYGANPWETLLFYSKFSELKENLLSDKNFLSLLIHRYFLDNKDKVLVTVTPSVSWSKKRVSREKAIVKELLAQTSLDQVKKDVDRMHRFQQKPMTKEEMDLLPRIHVSDLSTKVEKINTVVTEVETVPFFVNKIPTNGIVYFDLCFPVDVLPAKDYMWLGTLCSTITQIGWKGMPWDKAASVIQSKSGGINAFIRNYKVPDCSKHLIEEKNYVGRDWFCFSFKSLEDNVGEVLNLLAECILKVDFADSKRLTDLLNSLYNSFSSSLVPGANYYAGLRSSCLNGRNTAISEILGGITSLLFIKEIVKMDPKKVASKFRNIFARIKQSGAIIHVTATDRGIKNVKKCLPSFIQTLDLKNLAVPADNKDSDFYKLTALKGEKGKGNYKSPDYIDELVEIPGTVGFDSVCFKASSFDTKECVAEYVYSRSLSNNELWNTVRMVGGAYGVWLSPNSDNKYTRFVTYRDPKPFESLAALRECVSESAKKVYTKDEVEKAITGCYADEVSPMSPSAKGGTGFMRELYGMNNQQRSRRLKWLVNLTPKDLSAAAKRTDMEKDNHRTVILCGKELLSDKLIENAGKIIKLPL